MSIEIIIIVNNCIEVFYLVLNEGCEKTLHFVTSYDLDIVNVLKKIGMSNLITYKAN